MSNDTKKMAVLDQLQKEAAPIQLPELIDKLGPSYSERTLRRWLKEWTQTGQVIRTGKKRSTAYQAASKTTSTATFSQANQAIIEKVRRPLFERNPVGYQEEWLHEYRPNQSYYLSSAFRKEMEKIGNRSRNEEPAGTYAHHIFNRLLIDLSYNSSRLEGNTYSLLDTERLLIQGATAEGKLDEEKIMILNHKEAIRYLVDHAATIEISTEAIHTLHYLLADGLLEPRYSGTVRDHGVRIGGSAYIPHDEKIILERHLKLIAEKAAAIQDPFEQSFFLLVHLSYLQPYADVNKRTARLNANIPLIKQNYVPQSFIDVSRDDYTSAIIAIYELQNTAPLAELYLYSYKGTCIQYDNTVKTLGFDEIRVRYRRQRKDLLREIILKHIKGASLKTFLSSEASHLVPLKDHFSFIEDIEEDLALLDQSRISGLGITTEELKAWLAL